MKSWQKATLVALLHVAIVSTLGAKLLYDRATRPRVWVKTQNYDPNLPIRGRYVALRPIFDDPNPPKVSSDPQHPARWEYTSRSGTIHVVNGKAVVDLQEKDGDIQFMRTWDLDNKSSLTTWEPVLYFIPDTAPNPAALQRGEELWVEVTIPRKGPPRPIQLALKSNGVWKPLDVR
jgi:hypothetical protein